VPPDCSTSLGTCSGYFNSNNSGQQYVYGFRVPLLVVSAYATPGYVSGGGVYPPVCQGNTYCHYFGSILNFIEHVFALGEISPDYHYADHYVMDAQTSPPNNYSLYDFFNGFSQTYPFQSIGPLKYPEDCFHHPTHSNCFPVFPLDPDNDENESQTD